MLQYPKILRPGDGCVLGLNAAQTTRVDMFWSYVNAIVTDMALRNASACCRRRTRWRDT